MQRIPKLKKLLNGFHDSAGHPAWRLLSRRTGWPRVWAKFPLIFERWHDMLGVKLSWTWYDMICHVWISVQSAHDLGIQLALITVRSVPLPLEPISELSWITNEPPTFYQNVLDSNNNLQGAVPLHTRFTSPLNHGTETNLQTNFFDQVQRKCWYKSHPWSSPRVLLDR